MSLAMTYGSGRAAVPATRGHAIVLGAGMAGLFAARVLSEFYESVTVVERDALTDQPVHRKGVPQDRHLHNFLGRGVQVVAELFPGILDQLAAAGANVFRDGDLSRIYARVGSCELKRSGRLSDATGLTLCLATRPLVELHVRRRVAALPGVTLVDGHDVLESVATGDTVTGVRIVNRTNEITSTLDADLVVDATGRSARIPSLLERLGYGRPPEHKAPSDVGYSTQRLAIPNGTLDQLLVMSNQGAARPRVLLLACEQHNWMLTVGRSIDNGGGPGDFETMLRLAQQVLPPAICDGLRAGRPVDDIVAFRNPAAVWRRYDHMPRFPRGLLVMGDALCSLNPIYGQGMTIAALQALTLRDCLRTNDTELASSFFTGAAAHIATVWVSGKADDRKRSTGSKRSPRRLLRSHAVRATMIAASRDTHVAERFLRVGNLIDPPSQLADPALLPRIAAANARHLAARLRGGEHRGGA